MDDGYAGMLPLHCDSIGINYPYFIGCSLALRHPQFSYGCYLDETNYHRITSIVRAFLSIIAVHLF